MSGPSAFPRRRHNQKGPEMATYEHVFVARPDVSPAQVESLLEELKSIVEEKGGTVGKTEYWGLRTLAYRINKNRKGHYGLIDLDAGPDALEAIDQRQRYSDDVIRYMTVRVEELSEEPSAVLRKSDDRKRRERR